MNRTDEMVLKFREVIKETERMGPEDLWAYQYCNQECNRILCCCAGRIS